MSESRELSPIGQVCTQLQRPEFQAKLEQALPPGVNIDRFTRVTLTALQQNPSIANGDRQSLYNAVVRCAQDGLLPDGKQAALVMFGGAVQYMPMIGGLRNIAAKHGIAMATGVVHKNDTFEYELGIESRMVHKPAPLDQPRGDAIGAWAQARDADGNLYLEVMGREDIEKVRAVSRSKGNGPWVQQWGEMARKTVGRRLFKSLPITGLDERDARVIEAADADIDFDRDTGEVRDAGPTPAVTRRPSVFQRVAEQVAERVPVTDVDAAFSDAGSAAQSVDPADSSEGDF